MRSPEPAIVLAAAVLRPRVKSREEYEMSFVINGATWSLARAMHKLWADHVFWTRDYVVAAVGNYPDAEVALARLLKNQEDIGNAIVPFYGNDAGARLTELLKEHIVIAGDLITAAMTGDEQKFAETDKEWSRNAEDIAAFLSGANPNWPQKDVVDLLNLHLTLTKDEAVARMQADWDKDVAAFDEIFTEILTLSDILSEGIVRQFPEKFAA
jgi:hypothetical protein